MKALLRQLQNNGDSLSILVFGDNRFTAIGTGKPEEDFADFLENNSGSKKPCEVLTADYIKQGCASTDVRVVEFEPQVKFLRKPDPIESVGFMVAQASKEDIVKALETSPTDYEG